MKLYPALFALTLFHLSGCFGDRLSGGSSETENAVVARVFPADSLLPAWNRPDGKATVATLRLDSSILDFRLSDSLGRDLDVRRANGSRVPFVIAYWDRLRGQGRMQVRIEPDLRGPGGAIQLWKGLSLGDRTDSAGVWSGIAESARLELTSVLVDDFESANAAWFIASGSGIVAAGGGRQGNAMRVISTGTDPVVLAAALLAPTPRSLGSIDSIVFWVRGSGRLRVALEHALPGSQLVAWTPYEPDTAWHRVQIRPSSFDSAAMNSGGARWDEIRDSVTHLSFWLEGPGEVWIDDPRLFGIDREDLR
ncbi:MAG: hypothetical protein ABI036_01585 [Fibrobacteria bacterium]